MSDYNQNSVRQEINDNLAESRGSGETKIKIAYWIAKIAQKLYDFIQNIRENILEITVDAVNIKAQLNSNTEKIEELVSQFKGNINDQTNDIISSASYYDFNLDEFVSEFTKVESADVNKFEFFTVYEKDLTYKLGDKVYVIPSSSGVCVNTYEPAGYFQAVQDTPANTMKNGSKAVVGIIINAANEFALPESAVFKTLNQKTQDFIFFKPKGEGAIINLQKGNNNIKIECLTNEPVVLEAGQIFEIQQQQTAPVDLGDDIVSIDFLNDNLEQFKNSGLTGSYDYASYWDTTDVAIMVASGVERDATPKANTIDVLNAMKQALYHADSLPKMADPDRQAQNKKLKVAAVSKRYNEEYRKRIFMFLTAHYLWLISTDKLDLDFAKTMHGAKPAALSQFSANPDRNKDMLLKSPFGNTVLQMLNQR